ncbi:MAG: NYN domain-containing protein, partial [Planctomycetota bacterium]
MAGFGPGGGYRRSDPARLRVGLFVDLENLKRGALEGGGQIDVSELASRLIEMAREEGRVIHAAAYADWTDPGSDARAFRRLQMETKLVVGEEDAEPKCWLPMSLDVLETLYGEPRLDVYVICGGAQELEEIIRRLRRGDRKVVLCAGGYSCSQDLVQIADRFARVEDLLGPGGMDGESSVDFDRYDWGPFVRALEWHEKRMEFIGIGLLLKKILDHRNCGYTSYNRKREIFEWFKE